MADKTITINTQPQCRAVPPTEQAKRAVDRVRWRAANSDVCIQFAAANWPFKETYQSEISITQGQESGWYTPCGLAGQADYDFFCSACANVPLATTSGGSASIIISE